MQKIKFVKRLIGAKTPTRATEHAAGFDLYAANIEKVNYDTKQVVIDTGLNVEIPEGHVLYLFGRSGLAMKNDITLANCVGVIDADYRGPLMVLLASKSRELDEILCNVAVGDRVAQAVLMPIPEVEWEQVAELNGTTRGEGGFGSTGSK